MLIIQSWHFLESVIVRQTEEKLLLWEFELVLHCHTDCNEVVSLDSIDLSPEEELVNRWVLSMKSMKCHLQLHFFIKIEVDSPVSQIGQLVVKIQQIFHFIKV